MHNALTICMQRGLQCFSTGGWEHVTATGELEDSGKSLARSCLAARSVALGQHQMPLSCPVQREKSRFSGPPCAAGQAGSGHSASASPPGTGDVPRSWLSQAPFKASPRKSHSGFPVPDPFGRTLFRDGEGRQVSLSY